MPGTTDPISEADIIRQDFRVGTIAEEKLADPEHTPGSASDYAGVLDEAVRSTVRRR